jgi:tetratricopeptide (TPR) repeat protein
MKYLFTFLALILSAVALHAKPRGASPIGIGGTTLAMAGRSLTAEQVSILELALVGDPDNLSVRTKLLGYYASPRSDLADAKDARRKHILWIIKNHPETEIAGTTFASIDLDRDRDGYEAAKQLWLEQTKAHPKDPAVLGNAAAFLLLRDQYDAEDLLKEAQSLDPKNPSWSDGLGRLYQRGGSKAAAAEALAAYEKAQAVDKLEITKFYRLNELAKTAFDAGEFDKASQYAGALVKAAEKHSEDKAWETGDAVHDGNIVLGRIALKKGDVKQAKKFLLQAGYTPGSPILDSFGPNMSLAKELLDAGEKDIVLKYFVLCRRFWKMGRSKLDDWTKQVKDGQVPNFDNRTDCEDCTSGSKTVPAGKSN